MDKRIKWGIIVLVGAGLTALGIHTFTPGENKELAAAEKKSPVDKNKALNVNAKIIKPHLLTDQLFVSGKLMPDEEVDLSFETSGKITSIEFTEGSFVSKGQLLAKVNDSQLQAQLKRLEAQMPLAEDRVFRQNALLQRDAVSKEAYEQVKTELATLNADIENVKANIAMTELRAPFDGIIGLRQVSLGAYASPTTVIAKLTKITPLKVEFAVPERYARQIQKGTNLTFKIEGRLETFNSQVYATESRINEETHTLTRIAPRTLCRHRTETTGNSRCHCYPLGSHRAGNGEKQGILISFGSGRTGRCRDRYPHGSRSTSLERPVCRRYHTYFRYPAVTHWYAGNS